MITHLSIDGSLIKEACQLSGICTANDVATKALQEYILQNLQKIIPILIITISTGNMHLKNNGCFINSGVACFTNLLRPMKYLKKDLMCAMETARA